MNQSGPFLVAASYDLSISVTDISMCTSAPIKFGLQNAQANKIIGLPSNRFAVASNPFIFIYNRTAKTNKPGQSYQGHQTNVTDLCTDGSKLYSCSEDETWRVWDFSQPRAVATYQTGCCLNTITLINENKWVVTGKDNGNGEVWEADTGKLILSERFSPKAIRSIVPSNNGNIIVIGCQDGNAVIADVTAEGIKELRRVNAHPNAFITRVAASKDGRLFATASSDSTAKIWNFEDCSLVNVLEDQSQTKWIWDVAFTNDCKLICTGGTDKVCRIWDVETGTLKKQIEWHQKGVTCIAII